MSGISNLSALVKEERRHPRPTCSYIARRRNEYKDIPFGELIPLALYATVLDLQRATPEVAKQLARIASQRYEAKNGDFFKALSRYCKSLDPPQQAAALFEGAIHLMGKVTKAHASSDSPVTAGWKDWVFVSRTLLGQLTGDGASDGDLDASRLVLQQLSVDWVRCILGNFLYAGFNTSTMRKGEAGKNFTEAAHLHMASQHGEDFQLDIQIGICVGLAIAQLLSAGEDLRGVLV
ncbi:hypothetical protein OQA88_9130 [Cercophora sp. LCS_1]